MEVLEEARHLGFLGPGPVEAHARHAEGFVAAAGSSPRRVVDLGSGAGIPGLVLARAWPKASFLFVDSAEKRVDFLAAAVHRLGLASRVTLLRARAEDAGRDGRYRGAADLVVARGFGPPAVAAECGAALLEVGGKLVVSEPPGEGPERWPDDGLAQLGLKRGAKVVNTAGRFQVLVQATPCPPKFPRRTGVPAKRPLFGRLKTQNGQLRFT